MYHLELRQFPKKLNRYNLSGQQVGTIVIPWVQERIVELGEQKWSPHSATLTLYEAPEIAIEGISLARGWRTVERTGEDVTERVLAEARQAVASGAAGADSPAVRPAASTAAAAEPAADAGSGAALSGSQPAPHASEPDPIALGVQLGSLLGNDAAALLDAWRSVAARSSGLAPSESLALAEREIAQRSPGD
jgi:hypothetical protein